MDINNIKSNKAFTSRV